MLLTTPESISQTLYKDSLELHNPAADTRMGSTASPAAEISERERPVVTIGEPQYWNIAAAYQEEGKPVPAILRQMLDRSDFFLVRFACSFDLAEDMKVERARFEVTLASHNPDALKPISFDLYPLEVYDELKQDISLKVSPTLKFADTVEASLGEVALEIKYNKLVPVITAVGVQESIFSWEMRQTDKHILRGARWFHALLKVPREAQGVQSILNIGVHIMTPRGLFLGALRQEQKGKLNCLICV